MPYARRRRTNKRTNKSPTQNRGFMRYAKPAVKALTFAYQNRKLISSVMRKMRMLNVEVKYHDYTNAGSAALPSATSNLTQLTDINQGDTNLLRNGNSIKAVSFNARFNFVWNTQNYNPTTIRVLLLRTGYGENTIPQLGDVLKDPTNIRSFRNIDQSKGYSILMDRMIELDGTHQSKNANLYTRMGHHLKWDGTLGSDHIYGQLWFIVVDDEPTNHASYTIDTRLRFVDN